VHAVWLCASIAILVGIPVLKGDLLFTIIVSITTIGWVSWSFRNDQDFWTLLSVGVGASLDRHRQGHSGIAKWTFSSLPSPEYARASKEPILAKTVL
jgi:hypothetical protein